MLKILSGLVLTVLGGPVALAATPFNTLGPFVQYNLAEASVAGATTVFGNQWLDVSGPTAGGGTATVSGQGTVGVAKIGLAGTGTFDSFAWSGWNDTIVLSPWGVPGTTGRLYFTLNYDWSASVSGDGNAAAYIDVNLLGRNTAVPWQYAYVREDITRSCNHAGQCGALSSGGENGGVAGPGHVIGAATFSFEVESNGYYTMVVGLNTSLTGNNATVSVDATHSLVWGGNTMVFAPGGVPAMNLSIESASGFDYTRPAPVPEAPTLALWAVGLAALAWQRGARRH